MSKKVVAGLGTLAIVGVSTKFVCDVFKRRKHCTMLESVRKKRLLKDLGFEVDGRTESDIVEMYSLVTKGNLSVDDVDSTVEDDVTIDIMLDALTERFPFSRLDFLVFSSQDLRLLYTKYK